MFYFGHQILQDLIIFIYFFMNMQTGTNFCTWHRSPENSKVLLIFKIPLTSSEMPTYNAYKCIGHLYRVMHVTHFILDYFQHMHIWCNRSRHNLFCKIIALKTEGNSMSLYKGDRASHKKTHAHYN